MMYNNDSTLLICHRGAIGDFIFTWPAIFSLRKKFPKHKFIGLGKADIMKLGIKKGLIDLFFDCESASFLDFFEGIEIPDCFGKIHGAVLWMKKNPSLEKLLNKKFANFATFIDPFPVNPKRHIVEYYFDRVKNDFQLPCLKAFSDAIPDFKHNADSNTVLIHPGSGSINKNIPPLLFKKIINLFRGTYNCEIRVIAGPAEIERGIPQEFTQEKVLLPNNLSELDDIILSASVFIGNDSGVSHLASVNGLKTFAFYKTTDPAVWGTFGNNSKNIIWNEEKGSLACLFHEVSAAQMQGSKTQKTQLY